MSVPDISGATSAEENSGGESSSSENSHHLSVIIDREWIVLSQHLNGVAQEYVKVVAYQWLKKYGHPSKNARAERSIKELIVHSMGYKTDQAISTEDYISLNNSSFDQFLSEKQEGPLNPLVALDNYMDNVFLFLRIIWKILVTKNRNLPNNIHQFTILMLNSRSRAARYTAFLFIKIMGYIFLDFFVQWKDHRDENARRFRYAEVFESHIKKLTLSFMDLALACFFDVFIKIRMGSLKYFLQLCDAYPDLFLEEKILKNIANSMFDPNSNIRFTAVKAIIALNVNENVAELMDPFREEAIFNLVERTRDVNESVALEAVKGLNVIYRVVPQYFDNKIIKNMLCLLICNHEAVANASAEFFYLTVKWNVYKKPFLQTIVSLLVVFQERTKRKCHVPVVRALLNIAEKELTCWQAWTELLFEERESDKEYREMACLLLAYLIRVVITQKFDDSFLYDIPTLPSVTASDKPDESRTEVNYVLRYQRNSDPAAITCHFSVHFEQILKDFETEPNCVQYLLTIPEMFTDVNNLDVKEVYNYLRSMPYTTEVCFERTFAVLAALHRLMKDSDQYQQQVQVMEQELFAFCGIKLLQSCQNIVTKVSNLSLEEESGINQKDFYILRVAFCVARYFDLNNSDVVKYAIAALHCGISNNHSKITWSCAYMCLFYIHWQLKEILQSENANDDLVAKIKCSISQVITLLEPMLWSKSETSRQHVFTIFCRIYCLFSPKTKFIDKISGAILDQIDINISEWLNFYLLCQTPTTLIPPGDQFSKARRTLEKFCLFLISGALHFSYFSSIVPYFKFFNEEQNYNDILHNAMQSLVLHTDFSETLVKTLYLLQDSTSIDDTKIIALGVVTAGLIPRPSRNLQDVALEVVASGIQLIKKDVKLHFFTLLKPFAALLSAQQAQQVGTEMFYTLRPHTEDMYYRSFYKLLVERLSHREPVQRDRGASQVQGDSVQ